jgi:hypothetical protein
MRLASFHVREILTKVVQRGYAACFYRDEDMRDRLWLVHLRQCFPYGSRRGHELFRGGAYLARNETLGRLSEKHPAGPSIHNLLAEPILKVDQEPHWNAPQTRIVHLLLQKLEVVLV